MPRQWNDDCLRRQYERVRADGKRDGFTDDELEKPYLTKLSHQTKSHRIMRMIRLAYTLGWMRGIDYVDQGKTPVEIRPVGVSANGGQADVD